MGQLVLPNHKPAEPVKPQPKIEPKVEPVVLPKQPEIIPPPIVNNNDALSRKEKWQLFGLLTVAVCLPVLIVTLVINHFYDKKLKQYELYRNDLQAKLTHLESQFSYINNPAAKQVENYEVVLKQRIAQYNKEKEILANDAVYIATNKKMKQLDNEIIKCNVHLLNIEKEKQNNFTNITQLLETLKKEVN